MPGRFNLGLYGPTRTNNHYSLENLGANWGNAPQLVEVDEPSAEDPTRFSNIMKSFLGYTGADGVEHKGWAMPAIAGGNALVQGVLGMKQYGLARDAFNQGKKEFAMNWEANKQMTNSQLEDRQAARVAANPTAYQSVGEYMNKYGVR